MNKQIAIYLTNVKLEQHGFQKHVSANHPLCRQKEMLKERCRQVGIDPVYKEAK